MWGGGLRWEGVWGRVGGGEHARHQLGQQLTAVKGVCGGGGGGVDLGVCMGGGARAACVRGGGGPRGGGSFCPPPPPPPHTHPPTHPPTPTHTHTHTLSRPHPRAHPSEMRDPSASCTKMSTSQSPPSNTSIRPYATLRARVWGWGAGSERAHVLVSACIGVCVRVGGAARGSAAAAASKQATETASTLRRAPQANVFE